MMNLHVRHLLTYEYSSPVSLDPHTLYVYPKPYAHQRVLEYRLQLNPQPSKIVFNTDVEGNTQQVSYFFNEPVKKLVVEAEMTLSTQPVNVFDFVLYPFSTKNFPFAYDERDRKYLVPYLSRQDVTPSVEQFARNIAGEAGWETVPFLVALSQYIHLHFAYEQRIFGIALTPDELLKSRSGSCRDYVRLFMAACRSLGIASRFVSGYLYGNPQQAHELHAWAEVYLPGAGWRGFDPTEGKAIEHHHISVGASADFDLLAPVRGTYRGNAQGQLFTDVHLSATG